jgi:hypothetical protein
LHTDRDIDIKLNTNKLVETIRVQYQGWIFTNSRRDFLYPLLGKPSYNSLVTLVRVRQGTKNLLDYLHDLDLEPGEERQFWGYQVSRPEGKDYRVVKKLKGKVPGIEQWGASTDYSPVLNLFKSYIARFYFSKNLNNPDHLQKVGLGLCNTGFMQAVFNPGNSIDVSSSLLPRHDIKARLGNEYTMLFDNAMQEWRLWRKD